MLAVADGILDAALGTGQDDFRRLAKLRLQLSKEVSRHVNEEVALIRLQRGNRQLPDTHLNTLISLYHDELLVWRAQLSDCNVNWAPKRVQADQKGFCAAFRPLRDALEKRVRWEEEVFYPAVLSRDSLERQAA